MVTSFQPATLGKRSQVSPIPAADPNRARWRSRPSYPGPYVERAPAQANRQVCRASPTGLAAHQSRTTPTALLAPWRREYRLAEFQTRSSNQNSLSGGCGRCPEVPTEPATLMREAYPHDG